MNWNADIKDLTGRQILLVMIGTVAFFGLLYAVREYAVIMALIALAVYFVGRGVLASKGQ